MKILIAGDFAVRGRMTSKLEDSDFKSIFGYVKPLIEEADYSVVNLENPVASEDAKPIIKNGGNLKCSEAAIQALKYAGFKCVTLANNHFKDFDDEGCINTINELDKVGIDHLGGGKDIKEAQKVHFKEIGNVKLAFVNFCEHEFSIASSEQAGSAPLDLIDNYYQIKEARQNADYVIVIVHGGHEYYQLPSPRMKKTYRWFIELGADAVINHHQHCYTGYEVYCNKPIFYGIGNFCFDWNRRKVEMWEEGYMVEMCIDDNRSLSFALIPYTQCRNGLSVLPMEGEEKMRFFESIEKINTIIADDTQLSSFFQEWCKEKHITNESLLIPYSRKLTRALYSKGLLPSFLSSERIVALLNHIECEAHRDVFVQNLKNCL